MDFTDLEQKALTSYALSILSDKATPYECKCFFERWFSYKNEDRKEIMHKASIILVKNDPYFLIMSPHARYDLELSETEVMDCVNFWKINDEQLKAFLEGLLRMALVTYQDPNLDLVKKALSALDRACANFGEDITFLELYLRGLKFLKDDRSYLVFDKLMEVTDPEWRAQPLCHELEDAAKVSNWDRYDSLRKLWTALPKNAHVCECHMHSVANMDGVRALNLGDKESAIKFLKVAVSVNGCPHLNSGSASVFLAKALLEQQLAIKEIKEYLLAAEQYSENDEINKLKEEIASLSGGVPHKNLNQ